MATKAKNSEAQTLEQYRIALDNAEAQPAIAAAMSELGYDTKLIAEGKAQLADTRSKFDQKQVEEDEKSEAYAVFTDKKDQLDDTFTLHRKKAKVVFRNDPLTADQLAISGAMPRSYTRWTEVVKKFYSVALAEEAIQGKLARLKISKKDLTAAQGMISDMEAARSAYLIEKGESQDATKVKDAAFDKMDDWMSEFYAVARIGLEDNPQLLEALGKTVRG